MQKNSFKFAYKKILGFPIYFWLVVIILSFIKLWLVAGQHIFAIGNAPHDDGLFINLANNLIHLNWLGNYDVYTLIKGPFYPIWIAMSYFAHIPLFYSQHFLYILACIILIVVLRPLFKNSWVSLICFAIILFNPISFSAGPATRVIREEIYPALTILIVALFGGILLYVKGRVKQFLFWSLSAGITLSCFWLTREEGIWILPFAIFILCYSLFNIWKDNDVQWKKKVVLLVLPFILLYGSVILVSEINYREYGVFSVVEVNDPDFLNAYGALTRVKPPVWKPTVPVSIAQMKIIYSISPAFSELRPQFDGDLGKGWAQFRSQPIDPDIDIGEIQGGWFMWAFRDAVSRTSKSNVSPVYRLYDTSTGIHYYTISEPKKSSLENKQGSKIISEGIAFYEYSDATGDKASSPIYRSYDTNGDYYYSIEPSGKDNIAFYAYDQPQNGTSPVYDFVMVGSNKHFYTTSETEKDSVILHLSSSYKFNDIAFYTYMQYPPGSYYTNGALAMSYYRRLADEINSACDSKKIACYGKRSTLMPPWNSNYKIPLLNSIYQGLIYTVKLDGFSATTGASIGDEYSLKLVSDVTRSDVTRSADTSKISILNNIGSGYASILPTVTILSLLIFLFQLVNIKRNYKNLKFILSFSIAASFFARIFGLALITVTSFQGMSTAYLSPLYPLLLLFILLNFSMLYDIIVVKKLK